MMRLRPLQPLDSSRLLIEHAGETRAVGGETVRAELTTELDGRGVRVLADGAHVVVRADATLVDLLGVHAILGVKVLHLARGNTRYTHPLILFLARMVLRRARHCSLRASLRRLGPLRMIAAPPV